MSKTNAKTDPCVYHHPLSRGRLPDRAKDDPIVLIYNRRAGICTIPWSYRPDIFQRLTELGGVQDGADSASWIFGSPAERDAAASIIADLTARRPGVQQLGKIQTVQTRVLPGLSVMSAKTWAMLSQALDARMSEVVVKICAVKRSNSGAVKLDPMPPSDAMVSMLEATGVPEVLDILEAVDLDSKAARALMHARAKTRKAAA